MNINNDDRFNNLRIGEPQFYETLSFVPLYSDSSPSAVYRTMPELSMGIDVAISELGGGASVGELSVTNNTDDFVLLVDGEELVGAKQNRALNTTMMIRPRDSMRLPVSCTERGRWDFTTEGFDDSGVVMPLVARFNKKLSVDRALLSTGEFRSDQGQVWNDIDRLQDLSGETTSTDAMRDVYQSRRNALDEFVDAFEYQPGQTGMAVLLENDVIGLEVFSRESAMEVLAPKIIKSYGMDVLVGRINDTNSGGTVDVPQFLNRISNIEPVRFKSEGAGWDYRFDADNITGSALVYKDELIHASFYNGNRLLTS